MSDTLDVLVSGTFQFSVPLNGRTKAATAEAARAVMGIAPEREVKFTVHGAHFA